jgi:hypothetical protein
MVACKRADWTLYSGPRGEQGAGGTFVLSSPGQKKGRCADPGSHLDLPTHRLRAVDEAAATDIQRVTRGYMGRLWAKRLQRERHEIYRDGCARCIQAAWARYEWRRGWWIRAEGVRNEAATVVQARWRGVSGRRHLAKQRRMDRIRARRAASATKIQSAVRMWLTIKRLKKKLLAIDGGTEGCPASPKQVK